MPQSKNPVYVSSDNADRVLAEVKTKVSGATLKVVNSPVDFDFLFPPATSNLAGSPLDLLSHSYGDENLLLLGDIQAAAATSDFDTYTVNAVDKNLWMEHLSTANLRGIGLRQLRLLGCITAWSDAGKTTIKRLREDLDLDMVFGTKTYLSAKDFGAKGFQDDPNKTKLVSSAELQSGAWTTPNELPPLPDDALGIDTFDLDKVPGLQVEAFQELAKANKLPFAFWPLPRSRLLEFGAPNVADLYRAVGEKERKEGRSLPGLLTVPTHEYWIPGANDPSKFRLMHALFGWRMLRVYSAELMQSAPIPDNLFANSAVYRVRDWESLRDMMSRLPQTDITQDRSL